MKVSDLVLKNNEKAMFALRELYGAYGYSRFKMSKFEEYDLYVGNKNFLISDNIITFTDHGGKLMALKPDVTLSIVKNSKVTPGYVNKVYYDENVYRMQNESFKEIMQVGLECIGDIDDYILSEVLMLALKSLALISDDYVLNLSHLGILEYALEKTGASDTAKAALLRAVGKKNLPAIREICSQENLGDNANLLIDLVSTYGSPEKVFAVLEKWEDAVLKNAKEELKSILAPVASQVAEGKVAIDFSVVGDMNYYNGIVMKGFVNGISQSILSGGQYDKLLDKMGKKAGAVGFAVYPDLLDALAGAKKQYDVDTVILYEAGTSPEVLHNTLRLFSEGGKSVMAQKAIPEKLRYRQLLKLTESGVQILENNA
jgi:ATP phosphoribosyltransferase regulatory subunit